MAHSLTTRALAEQYRRERLLQLPPAPPRPVPLEENIIHQRAILLLYWMLGILFFLILGTALYPQRPPATPQASQPPVERGAQKFTWHEVNDPIE